MAKSMYAYVRDAWKRPEDSEVKALQWERMQTWRREGSVVRVEHPTRIDRARSLGYVVAGGENPGTCVRGEAREWEWRG